MSRAKTYPLGMRFRNRGETRSDHDARNIYVLAQVTSGEAKLIALVCGNRWSDQTVLCTSDKVLVREFRAAWGKDWEPCDDLVTAVRQARGVV